MNPDPETAPGLRGQGTVRIAGSGRWSLLLRTVITVSILLYLGVKLDWAEMARHLGRSDLPGLLVACAVLGAAFVAGSLRWWLLLKVQDIDLPFGLVTKLAFVGLFFNLFLFGAIGGDVLKAVYVMKYAPQKKTRATLSIIMDRAMGMFVFVCVVLAAIPWQFRFLMQREETRAVAYALAALFSVGALVAVGFAVIPFHRAPRLLRSLWERVPYGHIAGSLRDGFRQHGKALRYSLGALACSAIAVTITSVAGYSIARAIHVDASFLQIVVVLAYVICITSLPISIAGHGVREGAFVLMFAVFGLGAQGAGASAGSELAVLFSVIYFALHLFWGLIGGLVYLGLQYRPLRNDAAS